MKKAFRQVWHDEGGDAVVEATFLFPIIIIIFFVFVLLAMYLPTSVALQRSVQKAAHILAAQQSDLGYTYDIASDTAGVNFEKLRRENVYVELWKDFFSGFDLESTDAGSIVEKYAADALYAGKDLQISVVQDPHDKRYLLITAEQTLKMPFNFSFLPMSDEIVVTRSARVMNRDTDEFIRSMDIVYDLVIKKADSVKKTLGDLSNFANIFNRVYDFFGH